MSRAIEDYVCASEDRPHYNNEYYKLYGYYEIPQPPQFYPNQPQDYPSYQTPSQTPVNITINKTIIQQTISTEELRQTISDAITDNIEPLIDTNIDNAIDEIYGGSASDMIGV